MYRGSVKGRLGCNSLPPSASFWTLHERPIFMPFCNPYEKDPNRQLKCLTPVRNPVIPYTYVINQGIQAGMMIYIGGTPSKNFKRFSISLQTGSGKDPNTADIAFHFDVRAAGSEIIRNTRSNGKWETEEKPIPYFPFQACDHFDMLIRIQGDRYMVAISGHHFIDFSHRITKLKEIDTLVLEKDICVTAFQVCR